MGGSSRKGDLFLTVEADIFWLDSVLDGVIREVGDRCVSGGLSLLFTRSGVLGGFGVVRYFFPPKLTVRYLICIKFTYNLHNNKKM